MGPEPADVDGRWTRPLSQRAVGSVSYYSLTDPEEWKAEQASVQDSRAAAEIRTRESAAYHTASSECTGPLFICRTTCRCSRTAAESRSVCRTVSCSTSEISTIFDCASSSSTFRLAGGSKS